MIKSCSVKQKGMKMKKYFLFSIMAVFALTGCVDKAGTPMRVVTNVSKNGNNISIERCTYVPYYNAMNGLTSMQEQNCTTSNI